MKKILASILAFSLILTGCKTNGRQIDAEFDPTLYHGYVTKDKPITSLDYLVTTEEQNLNLLGNIVEGLLEEDNYGKLIPCLATDTGRALEGGKVWEFTIKEGQYWLNALGQKTEEEITAVDFVFGLKYALKNNTTYRSHITSLIAGAEAFIAGNDEALQVEAVDRYTLRYHLTKPCSYFNSYLVNGAFYPLNENLYRSVEKTFGTNANSVFYNGPYYLSLYNEETAEFTKNPFYWDLASVTFEKGTINRVENDDEAFDLFKDGDLSYAYISDQYAKTNMKSIDQHVFPSNSDEETLALVFNFQSNNKAMLKALKDDSFRKAIYAGVNPEGVSSETTEDTKTKVINVSAQSTLTPVSFLISSQGDDYVTLGSLKNVSSKTNFDQALSDEYAQKAIESLTAAKVTLPLEIRVPVDASKPYLKAHLEQAVSTINRNLVTFTFEEYVTADISADIPQLTTIVDKNAYDLILTTVAADYGDPSSILSEFTKDGLLNATYAHMNDDAFNLLYQSAMAINEQDKRLMAFAECESYLLQKAYVIPFSHGTPRYKVTSINEYTMPSGLYGLARYKLKNITALDACITNAEREELKTAYEANKVNG